MEILKHYKFSDNQMKELHEHMHNVQETSKLLEAFVKAQEGLKYTRDEAEQTLSLLSSNINSLNERVGIMTNQVASWQKALKKAPGQEAFTLREFLQSKNLSHNTTDWQPRLSYWKKKTGVEPVDGQGNRQSPYKYSASDLAQFVKEFSK